MSIQTLPIISTTVNADTNCSPNSIAYRDSQGGLTVKSLYSTSLQTSGNYVGTVSTQTTSFTAGAATHYLVDCTSGAVTVTLPTASANTGVVYSIMKIDSGSNHVTLSSPNGTTSLTTQYQKVSIVSDGTNWWSA
jgi:hypothetical protein